jgi:creatinine amidohydrolase
MNPKLRATAVVAFALSLALIMRAKELSAGWDELTAGDFIKAIGKAQGTCLLPFGILEKHGLDLTVVAKQGPAEPVCKWRTNA